MIDSREPPKRGSGSVPVVTPLVEARNALIEARKIAGDLEDVLTSPAFGKLKDTREAWNRLRRMLNIIGEGLNSSDTAGETR